MTGRLDRSSTTVRVAGMPRLRKDLRALTGDLADLKDANYRTGQLVLPAARSRAPHRSGRLAGSGRASRAASRITLLFGGASTPYAGPIHWGWPRHHIEAQPFAAEAAADTEPAWTKFYADAIDQALERRIDRTY